MDPPAFPYADIVEVRNVGRRRANALLAHDWVLLDWVSEQHIQQRYVSDAAGQPQSVWFKIEMIQYVLGRPREVLFTSADLEEQEKREDSEKHEARRQGDEHKVAANLPDGVEEEVREAVTSVPWPDTGAVATYRPRPDTPTSTP